MLRNPSWTGTVLVMALGCTPGPVGPRPPPAKTTGTGNTGGSDARAVAQDAAVRLADAAGVVSPGKSASGAGGRAALDAAGTVDAALGPPHADGGRDGPAARRSPDASDAAVARAPRPGEIVIDELLVNPAGDDLGREWVEIVSRAGEALDLSQLHLATATADVPAPAGTLEAGATLLLGQSSDPAKNGGAPVAVAYGTKLILVNADGQLSLCLGACATGVVLDAFAWGTLADAYTGHALIVDPATGAFCAAQTPFGTGGSFGTPGAPNPSADASCSENVDGGSRADVSVAD